MFLQEAMSGIWLQNSLASNRKNILMEQLILQDVFWDRKEGRINLSRDESKLGYENKFPLALINC